MLIGWKAIVTYTSVNKPQTPQLRREPVSRTGSGAHAAARPGAAGGDAEGGRGEGRPDPRQPASPFRVGRRASVGAREVDRRPGHRHHRRSGRARPRGEKRRSEVVDGTFDAFGREGAGALAAWMILSGNRDALNPILDSIHVLVAQSASATRSITYPRARLWLVLAALGDSLLGEPIAGSLGLQRDAARRIATEYLRKEIEAQTSERSLTMISGAHVMIFTRDEEADRAFLPRCPRSPLHRSSGGGWLIYKLPLNRNGRARRRAKRRPPALFHVRRPRRREIARLAGEGRAMR